MINSFQAISGIPQHALVRRSQRMRLNLFQYSLPSETLALAQENSAGLDQLRADLHKEHQPTNTTEELLVNEIAEQYWRLRRARAMETDLLASSQTLITHLAAIQRMMSSAERGSTKRSPLCANYKKTMGSFLQIPFPNPPSPKHPNRPEQSRN